MKTDTASHLFLPSGCLRPSALQSFNNHTLSLDEKQAAELHLKSCELCSDALEGYSGMPNPEMAFEKSQILSEQLIRKYASSSTQKKDITGFGIFLRVAAGIILLIGTWFLFREINPSAGNLSMNTSGNVTADTAYTNVQQIQNENELPGKKLLPPDISGIDSSFVSDQKINLNTQTEKLGKKMAVPGNPKPEHPAPQEEYTLPASEEIPLPAPEQIIPIESGKEKMHALPAVGLTGDGGPSGKTMQFYYNVEDMPRFRSGDLETFRAYIQSRIHYPKSAIRDGVEGTVYVSFIVEPNGVVSHVNILQGVSRELNQEALRVVGSSPAWRPGRHHGEKVNVGFIVPVRFQIQ